MNKIMLRAILLMGMIPLIFNACACNSHPNICGKGNSDKEKKSIFYKIYHFNKDIALLYTKPLNVVTGNIENRTIKEAPIKDITSSLKYALNVMRIVSTKNTTGDYTLDIDVVDLDTVDSLVSTTLRFGLKDKSGKNIKNILKKIIYKKKSKNEVSFTISNSGFYNIKARDVRSSMKILVVLGVTELLGRVNKFPYWVVTKQKADETMLDRLTKGFLRDTLNQKVLKISSLLYFKYNQSLIYGKIHPTKSMNNSLKSAIIKYKKSHNMSADTTLSRQFYRSLLKEETNDTTTNN
jgi:hypothetical protein